ncbi:uncharacterized protein K452DRAFT_218483 [Aplosporella prunicola CBS 121167]|uniref:OPA3-like protein n=1 Tax=Aplosporella prunicola CBS 121167 TaxID=1176127 RepID=A0A6A6BUK6_9PEZI|nr:uncharacterized protein K452DRAFT_218483 [Aplosporella prunicola CBS 121167]KAF2146904.1 hypothetical protein K452DRAFT_218483 [Aplosporella prunicola CBS 121167]
MSLTLKIGSLFIRTLAKPIANGIKKRARDHDIFRRRCVSFAQGLHRLDVRWRVGLLQDPAIIDRQIQRELREAEERRKRANSPVPTVKTESQAKADEEAAKHEKEAIEERHKRPRVRPLSEAKAIDMGANFISEGFMFLVAGGVIVFEAWRSRRKASGRRDVVDEKLEELQKQNEELQQKLQVLESHVQEEEHRRQELRKKIREMVAEERAEIARIERSDSENTADRSTTGASKE